MRRASFVLGCWLLGAALGAALVGVVAAAFEVSPAFGIGLGAVFAGLALITLGAPD